MALLKKNTSGGGGGHSFTVNTKPSVTQQVAEAQRVNEALRQAQAQSAQAQANQAKAIATTAANTGAKSGAKAGLTGTSIGTMYSGPATVPTTTYKPSYGTDPAVARKAEQDAAAWQQQYDNLYNTPNSDNGGGNGGGSSSDGSATRALSGSSSSGGGGGASTASLIGNLVTDPTAEVRQRYAGILADLANNNQYVLDKLKGNYDTSVNTINADYDTSISRQNADAEDALRQAYINYMMSRKNMDSALARQGYTGGLSESNQARMFNNYGNIRNDIRKTLNNAIENYNLKRNAALGEALNQYNAQLADQASDYFNKKQNYETALSNALANLMR